MSDPRPDPDELLARIKEEESRSGRGRLKIFLGAAAGVGKTYKMLESAKELLADGVDVIAGCVVTHGRQETEKLVAGFEVLPLKIIEYKNSTLHEFDIDAALKRKPEVILVDELAHTNAPGSRHEKRFQDVEELLEAGISVYTTLNIQHLESANDVVASITSVHVRETVPDSTLEQADEVELVDLPPDELIQRLNEGKVYIPEKTAFALENFFRKGNLIALRELALRYTAERVDKQMQKYRSEKFVNEVWAASERIMVCVGPSPLSPRLVRAAKRIASGLRADWIAAYVETPDYIRLAESERNRLSSTLRLAEQLGAESAVLTGTNASEELVAYARKRNVSRIIIGKPARARWIELIFGSIVDDLIRKSGNIDVLVITGDVDSLAASNKLSEKQSIDYFAYLKSLFIVSMTIVIAKKMFDLHFSLVNLVMIFQLAVVWIALRYGRGPSILASVVSVAACDFFFVPPYLSFAVSDTEYLITLSVMLIVALTLSTLTYAMKQQSERSRLRERRTAALYAMTKEQAVALSQKSILETSIKHIKNVFDCSVAICLLDDSGDLVVMPGLSSSYDLDAHEFAVAYWVFVNGQMAGAGTSTLPGSKAVYLPLRGSAGCFGSIGILCPEPKRLSYPEERHFLETFVMQTALAVERARLSQSKSG